MMSPVVGLVMRMLCTFMNSLSCRKAVTPGSKDIFNILKAFNSHPVLQRVSTDPALTKIVTLLQWKVIDKSHLAQSSQRASTTNVK